MDAERRGWSGPLTLCLAVAACACSSGATEAPRTVGEYTIEQFLGTTSFTGLSFAPDGKSILVSSDETGVFNAYSVPVGGGDPVRLTDSTTDSIFVRSWFPDGRRLLYVSDQGGNELTHLFVREADGTVTDLTPGDGLKARFHDWAADDRSMLVGTNERDPKYFDVYRIGADDYARSLVWENNEGYDFEAISRDGRYLALSKPRTTLDSDAFLYDTRERKMRHITPHEGNVIHEPQAFTADGRGLLMTTDAGAEFRYLVRYDIGSGGVETLVQPDWDVTGATLSKGGRYLVVRINNDARTEVRVYEAGSMTPVELPQIPEGEIDALIVADDERSLAFYVSSSRQPRDLFVQHIGGGQPQRLTRSLNPEIASEDLVDARVVRFESWDGTRIPGILYRPHQAGADSLVPALVWVHGGPGGQSRVGYSGLIQYLVNHGYAIYAINNRGSSGYGKTFFGMDDRRHGEADLDDCVASKAMLVDTGWVDPQRIGIIGGSYGGYMVLAALAFRPEEFALGVDIFGVANWVRTLESIPPWWESFREALYVELGDPSVDGERLRRISPLFHAGNISRPLLVLQGANDPRVLKIESDEMVEAARANGAVVDYVVFDDEGHGFRKKENRLKGYRTILDFLDRHL